MVSLFLATGRSGALVVCLWVFTSEHSSSDVGFDIFAGGHIFVSAVLSRGAGRGGSVLCCGFGLQPRFCNSGVCGFWSVHCGCCSGVLEVQDLLRDVRSVLLDRLLKSIHRKLELVEIGRPPFLSLLFCLCVNCARGIARHV